MNNTAKYICGHVQGVKTAFVQSDEISFILTDFDTPETDSFLDIVYVRYSRLLQELHQQCLIIYI